MFWFYLLKNIQKCPVPTKMHYEDPLCPFLEYQLTLPSLPWSPKQEGRNCAEGKVLVGLSEY